VKLVLQELGKILLHYCVFFFFFFDMSAQEGGGEFELVTSTLLGVVLNYCVSYILPNAPFYRHKIITGG
jgi:hypothetical protein